MLPFLLAVALPVPTPQVTVRFANSPAMVVTGPANTMANAEFPWVHAQTLFSPRGDAAAVRFCWDAVKYHGCDVRLVRPTGTPISLRNSNVTKLHWSPDGQYLIGAGANTLRLWNLVGGVRAATPFAAGEYAASHSSSIRDVQVHANLLVVTTNDHWSDRSGCMRFTSMTRTVYAVPTLKVHSRITTDPVASSGGTSCGVITPAVNR